MVTFELEYRYTAGIQKIKPNKMSGIMETTKEMPVTVVLDW